MQSCAPSMATSLEPSIIDLIRVESCDSALDGQSCSNSSVASPTTMIVDLDAQPRVSTTTTSIAVFSSSAHSSDGGEIAPVTAITRESCEFVPSCQFGDGDSVAPYIRMSLEQPVCVGCGYEIRERFLLKVVDDFWHETCLICFGCGAPLSDKTSCFIKDGRIYCRDDHRALFAQKCARCALPLLATDFVYRCLGSTYHTHCFACVYCGQQLKKGDQYLIIEGQIICRQDYELLLCNPAMTPGYYDPDATESNRKTPKRPRTILNSQQRRAFKASFEKSAKPCRKVREALAKETGLSVRVVQVWFQNQRAKMKKIQRKQELQKMHENRSNSNNNDKSAKSSDSEHKSVDDAKSPTESLKSEDSDSEGEVFDQENGSEREPNDDKDLANPIDKLYNMQTTYFAYTA